MLNKENIKTINDIFEFIFDNVKVINSNVLFFNAFTLKNYLSYKANIKLNYILQKSIKLLR